MKQAHTSFPAAALVASLVAALAAGIPAAATAGTQDPGVNKRQHIQRARIKDGVQSGELTRRETRGLIRGQRHIQREERRYKSDGHLSPRERLDLHRDLSRSSRQIYRQKHDDQTRGNR